MRSLMVVAAAVFLAAAGAGAQIIRAPGGDPGLAVTASLGFSNSETIVDGSSGTVWDFGSALLYRLSLERRVSDQVLIGAMVSYASVPLRYGPIGLSVPSEPTCSASTGGRCSATVEQTTIAATLSSGGSYGLHQVLNLSIGMTMFNDFREDATGRELAPISPDRDFFLAIGVGIGIGFSSRFALNIVQDLGYIVHQRSGVEGNYNQFHRTNATRLGLRVGVGR